MRPVHRLALALAVSTLSSTIALDNGLALTPPSGWRSWNLFGGAITQALMENVMDAMTSRSRTVNGVPTSLADLGFNDVGLDDAWQACGSYGAAAYTYHNPAAAYAPTINAQFPSLLGMTSYAHSLNLTVGWYGNNCGCQDHCALEVCYAADVNATIAYGFDSTKLDGCGAQLDLSLWAALFNATGHRIMIENCHWGGTVPNATWCPWSYYRTSGDIEASYPSLISNAMTVLPWAGKGLSYPGCWAYPDMLEIGVVNGVHGPTGDPGLSPAETRTHFGMWCILSAPLILGFDVTDSATVDAMWPLVSNGAALAINRAWAGFSGTVYLAAAGNSVALGGGVTVPAWQLFYKPINASATALLLVNHANATVALTASFADVPGAPCTAACAVTDVWAQAPLGVYSRLYTSPPLAPHDAAFLIVTPPAPAAVPPRGAATSATLTATAGDFCVQFWEWQLFDAAGRNVVGAATLTAPATLAGSYVAAANDGLSFPFGGAPAGVWLFHSDCLPGTTLTARFAPALLTTLILHMRCDCCTARPVTDAYVLTIADAAGAPLLSLNFAALAAAGVNTAATVLVVPLNASGVATAPPATPVVPAVGDTTQAAMASAWVRYVSLVAPGGAGRVIGVREVQVFDDTATNVALNKPCNSTGAAAGSAPAACARAVDHVIDFDNPAGGNAFTSESSTSGSTTAWTVDLGGVYRVTSVVVYNVYDRTAASGRSSAARLAGTALRLLNAAGGDVVAPTTLSAGAIQTIKVALPTVSPSATPSLTPSASTTATTTATASVTPSPTPSLTATLSLGASPSSTPPPSVSPTPSPASLFPSFARLSAGANSGIAAMEALVFTRGGALVSAGAAGAVAAWAPGGGIGNANGSAAAVVDLCVDPWSGACTAFSAPGGVWSVGFAPSRGVACAAPPCPADVGYVIIAASAAADTALTGAAALFDLTLLSGAAFASVRSGVSPFAEFAFHGGYDASAIAAPAAVTPEQAMAWPRYVRLQSSGNCLNFKEVMVFDAAYNNAALYRNATSSGVATWWGGSLAAANDGVVAWSTVNANIFHAPFCNSSDFWQVDLGGPVHVVAVLYWGRPTWTARNAGIVISFIGANGAVLGAAPPLVGTADVQLITFTPFPTPSSTPTVTASVTPSRSRTPTPTAAASASATVTATHSTGASASGSLTPSPTLSSSTTTRPPYPVGVAIICPTVLNFIELFVFSSTGQNVAAAALGASAAFTVASQYQTQSPAFAIDLFTDPWLAAAANPQLIAGTSSGPATWTLTFPPAPGFGAGGFPVPVSTAVFINRLDGSPSWGSRINASGPSQLSLLAANGSIIATRAMSSAQSVSIFTFPDGAQTQPITPDPASAFQRSAANQAALVRYVTIASAPAACLFFRELFVFDNSSTNVAFFKPATMGSGAATLASYADPVLGFTSLASYGVDGVIDMDASAGNLVNLPCDGSGWWSVDLGGVYNVSRLVFFNRYPFTPPTVAAGAATGRNANGATVTLANAVGATVGSALLTGEMIQSIPITLVPPVASSTATGSGLATGTPSASLSGTPSSSHTAPTSGTPSGSPSATLSGSRSSSQTGAASPSQSGVATSSRTATATASVAQTATPSRTAAATITSSPSHTKSASSSGTAAASASMPGTAAPSTTTTPSRPPSISGSPSGSIASTPSPTRSPPSTRSSSRTAAKSKSGSPSSSPSQSPSSSVSATLSPSASAASTASAAATATPSSSPSASAMPTPPPSASASPATASRSASHPPTPSHTPSATPTPSKTASRTATATRSGTAVATTTRTSTRSPTGSRSGTRSPSASRRTSVSGTPTRKAK